MSNVAYDTSSTPQAMGMDQVMSTPWVRALIWCAYEGHEWHRISDTTARCRRCGQYRTTGGTLTLEEP